MPDPPKAEGRLDSLQPFTPFADSYCSRAASPKLKCAKSIRKLGARSPRTGVFVRPGGIEALEGYQAVSFINEALHEINCKIVYYGPGLSGKTTNLQRIFEQTAHPPGDKMLSLATNGDRTLFFDFLPLDLGSVRNYKVRLHLYTVPGQAAYRPSRKLILRGADGVVFVADSQSHRMEDNLAAIEDLQQNLSELGQDLLRLPYALQLNKLDLSSPPSTGELKALLVRQDEPVFEAVANRGAGVLDTLKGIGRLVLARVRNGCAP